MERSDQPPDDKELWQDFVLKGREESFHLLVQRHKIGLFNAAYRILYDTHAAEDVVQRVFVALIERKNELAEVESLQCWLYRATFNQALNMKKLRRRRRDRERVGETASAPETPRETAVKGELREELDLALAKLKHSLRIPLILRYLQGMSHAETGEVLGLSSEATRKRITRALKRLRKLLTGRGLLLSLLALEEGLRAVPAKAASANFLTSTSSLLNAASTGAAASEAAISSTALITGVTTMTAKVKIAMGIIAILAVAVILTFTLRPTHRERGVAPPSGDSPRQTAAKRPPRPRTAIPDKSESEQILPSDELEEVPLGSISGRLIDTEGNIIEDFGERTKYFTFQIEGQGVYRPIEIRPDGTYEVIGLAPGLYSIQQMGWTFVLRGQYYCSYYRPQGVPTGTTDADIIVISGNPGRIRGRAVYAQTMAPVTRFTVFHKGDLESVPDRSRQSEAYSLLGTGYLPDINAAKREYDSEKKRVESLRPDSDREEILDARSMFEMWRLLKNSYLLNIESAEGAFEQGGYLLGKHVFTVVAEGCLPNSVEVELKDAELVELTFFMREDGSTVAGRVEDDSGNPVKDALVEILVPTGTEYFYSWLVSKHINIAIFSSTCRAEDFH